MTVTTMPGAWQSGEPDANEVVLPPLNESLLPTIPEFEGQEVSFTRANIAGASGQEIGDRAYPIDSTLKLVVECRVQGVSHLVNQKTGKLERVHLLKILEVMVMEWGIDMEALREALTS